MEIVLYLCCNKREKGCFYSFPAKKFKIMKQIANILMDYGFDFDYEHHGSNGESIVVHQLDLKVSTYQGTVFFEHDGESEEFEENVDTFNRLRSRTEKLIISETSSFE